MKKWLAPLLAISAAASPAAAHEVWIERDGAAPARIYLGEPAEAVPESGDPEFPKLKAPVLFTGNRERPAPLVRRTNHIEAAVSGAGDVRLVDDNVFEPWAGEDGKLQGVVYHARAGRTETRHALDLEIVPLAAGGDSFAVLWQGSPLPGAKLTIIDPDRWAKSTFADDKGVVAVPARGKGRYLLSTTHEVKGDRVLSGKPVASTVHVSTLTYVAP
ncbi:DUF4198 domain-containing protein [Sphingopyxis sp. MSC1_008]|jgi:uncharacterized GH25 family protein|uniref:DUF4198 domain-containing protein n=1 Tax=Sphingopyxis sp. MSC1_008 TaxID=2909265 RepID=UPI0020C01790|nr:DUF4198 domain-containing protein [Sphingopyxis sp. MSC1_008]